MFNARSTNPTSGQVINDNIQKILKTTSKAILVNEPNVTLIGS